MPRIAKQYPPNPSVEASGAVGQRLANLFRIDVAPSLVTTGFRTGNLAVTEIRSDNPVVGLTDPVAIEDAYLLCLFLQDCTDHQIWENGRALPRRTYRANDLLLRDLKRSQAAFIEQPHHSLLFYLPRAVLNELADDAGAARINEISHQPGVPVSDTIVKSLATCLQPALASPEQVNRLFIEHVLHAVGIHVASAYGGMKARSKPSMGGLAGWQEKRAKEILIADLTGATSLTDIALDCRLSVSQFSRAFKQSTGVAPHCWLIQQRVEAAKHRLTNHSMSLVDIALACGFADQSHLTRVFAQHTGVTPAAWRRSI